MFVIHTALASLLLGRMSPEGDNWNRGIVKISACLFCIWEQVSFRITFISTFTNIPNNLINNSVYYIWCHHHHQRPIQTWDWWARPKCQVSLDNSIWNMVSFDAFRIVLLVHPAFQCFTDQFPSTWHTNIWKVRKDWENCKLYHVHTFPYFELIWWA